MNVAHIPTYIHTYYTTSSYKSLYKFNLRSFSIPVGVLASASVRDTVRILMSCHLVGHKISCYLVVGVRVYLIMTLLQDSSLVNYGYRRVRIKN